MALVARLVEQATALGTRAPELGLILGERAAALAESAGAGELWVRAESLVVHARVRLGHRASTVGRAVSALRAAEDARYPVTAAQLRTDLAVCARSVGAPLTGLAALRPVLTVNGLSSVQRATALCHLVGCLGTFGRKVELDRVMLEGDRLISVDGTLGADDKQVARALLRVGVSAHRRRHGDLVGAADAARTGLGFLDDLADSGADGGLARVRLALELVCALLDRGDSELAKEVAEPVLAEPERAGSVAPLGWLRLAIATRVQLLDGSAEAAAHTLRDAVHSTSRHGLYSLTSRLWLELAHVEERIGQADDAIQCLYRARAAGHLHSRVSDQARGLLTGAFGAGEQTPVDLAEMVAAAAQASGTQAGATAQAAQDHAQRHTDGRRSAERDTAGHAERGAETPVAERPSAGRRSAGEPGVERFGAATASARSEGTMSQARETESRERVVLPMVRFAPGADGSGRRSAEEPVRDTEASTELPARRPATGQGGKRRKPDPDEQPADTGARAESAGRNGGAVATNAATARNGGRGRHGDQDADGPQRDEPLWDVARPPFTAPATTRHDSEHGSVDARSVLDRLGIAPGGAGGRRRASDDEAGDGHDVPGAGGGMGGTEGVPRAGSASWGMDGLSSTEPPAPEQRRAPSAPPPEENDFLPRLKLPPSLAPVESLLGDTDDERDAGSSGFGGDPATTATLSAVPADIPPPARPASESMTSGGPGPGERDTVSGDPPSGGGIEHGMNAGADDPPADAGLAELLARALAEHQAGTSSASALVKQLGVDDESTRRPSVNSRHRGER